MRTKAWSWGGQSTPGMTVEQFTGPEGRGVSRDSDDPRKSRHCCLGPSFPLSVCQVHPTLFQRLCFVLHLHQLESESCPPTFLAVWNSNSFGWFLDSDSSQKWPVSEFRKLASKLAEESEESHLAVASWEKNVQLCTNHIAYWHRSQSRQKLLLSECYTAL